MTTHTPETGGQVMSPAEVACTRHLLGLSQTELCGMLGIARSTLHDWERGKFSPSAGLHRDLSALRALHDAKTEQLAADAKAGETTSLAEVRYPDGWHVGLGARILDRMPHARIEWE